MPAASGLQIAFLVLAFEFFSMLASKSLAPVLGWPADRFELLGQLVTFSVAALMLAGIPALRRYCLAELRVPVPPGSSVQLIAACVTNVAIPFAVVGAVVIQAFATGNVEQLSARIPSMDPATAWDITLSPLGLLRLLLLSWIVGPVIEELVFRGLLYRAFERQWGWLASTAVTSLLFGLVHPTHIVATALGSVVLVCVLRRTGSLRACILVHMGFNVLVSWPLLGQLLLTAPAGSPASLATWTLPLACLTFAAVALPAQVWMSRTNAACADSAPVPAS
jgi:membrane protease YdiL (CAAX protease family)